MWNVYADCEYKLADYTYPVTSLGIVSLYFQLIDILL